MHGTYVPDELLSRLVGYRLYSVQFVMDYVQLQFDSDTTSELPVLTCQSFPTVTRAGRIYVPGDLGWADALRRLIPAAVTRTGEGTESGLEIRLGDDRIRVHPTLAQLDGPEVAMLAGFRDGRRMVWRPGEDSFEDLA